MGLGFLSGRRLVRAYDGRLTFRQAADQTLRRVAERSEVLSKGFSAFRDA